MTARPEIWQPLSGLVQGRIASYMIGAFMLILTYAARHELGPALGTGSPYPLFSLAILIAALLGGARAAAVVGLISAELGLYIAYRDGITPVQWAQFLLFTFFVITLVGMMALAATLVKQARQREAEISATQLKADQIAQELELLIDSASNYAICMLDPQGHITIWNMGAERIFGWSEEEALGHHYTIFFAAEEAATGKPAQHLAQARKNGRFEDCGWRVRKDGSDFLASVTMTEIRDAAGKEIGFGKVVRDITDEQAHADLIDAREVQLRSILATVPDAMVVIDDQGIITSFSAAAERMFGYSQTEALGQNVSLLMPSPDRQHHDGYLTRYLDTGRKHVIGSTRRVIGRRKDGTCFPHAITVGEAIGGGERIFTGFMRDLSAQEEAEAQLKELQAELLHISRVSAMGTMASTLAHELNQPLTAVTNYVQTSRALMERPDSDTIPLVREALREAGDEALRAGRIVRRLREFVARGELTKSIEPAARLIEDACMLGLAGASEHGIARTLDLDPTLGPLLIDRVQIEQVLINLIRNAVEAMAPDGAGQIQVSTRKEGEFARITVADTGPGPPPEVAEQLFQAFVSTKRGGMGLGLSICRTIIEAHGGKIWAEARTTGGAAFHFTVPRVVTEDNYA